MDLTQKMKSLFTILILLLAGSVFGQEINPETKALLDTLIRKAAETSMYSSEVNWKSLEKSVYDNAEGAQSIEDCGPAFETLINGLRDRHGRVISMTNYRILANFTDYENSRHRDDRVFDLDNWKIVNDTATRFSHALLPGEIAYLRVVGIGPNVDGFSEASRIRKAIRSYNHRGVKQWIIDLRYNGGGNSNVMLAGLAPLLNIQQVATIRDADGKVSGTAEVRKGNFWYFGQQAYELENEPVKNSSIAILSSRWTVSSGELVAVAFKGQENVRFFGEASGGQTTNTGWETIGNQIALVIGTGFFSDRNGVIYTENVPVDEEILFVVESDKSKDTAIVKASDWLKDN